MIDYRIVHRTHYRYAEAVTLCQNLTHLAPRSLVSQPNPTSSLKVTPEPTGFQHRLDYFGNSATYFALQEPHRELIVEATHRVLVMPRAVSASTAPWEQVRDRLRTDLGDANLEAREFAHESRYVSNWAEFREFAAESFPANRPILDGGLDFAKRIFAQFKYDPRATTIATPIREVFRTRRGVCQDFAHFMLAGLRSLGLAARYISGYLSTTPLPGQPRLVGADASHAWVSLFCGDAGWIDLDPTNNQLVGEKHIVLAWGRDYDDVSPVKGVILGGGAHTVAVSVDAIGTPTSGLHFG